MIVCMEKLLSAHVSPFIWHRNYGCGAVFPEAVEGCSVLDLGSGAGLDCFVLSKLVGPDGHVTGVDMTPEQVRSTYTTSYEAWYWLYNGTCSW